MEQMLSFKHHMQPSSGTDFGCFWKLKLWSMVWTKVVSLQWDDHNGLAAQNTLFSCNERAHSNCYCGSSVWGKLDWSQGDSQM